MEYPSLGTPPAGSLRFNTDSSKMEIYNGDKWWEIDATSPAEQTGGTRGLFIGGSAVNTIDYINVSTTGNAADFGDMTITASAQSGSSDRTRAVWAGGYTNTIQYVTITSTGNASDFGDLLATHTNYQGLNACADRTRVVWGGGYVAPSVAGINIIQYVTTQSTGNAVDFGDVRDRWYQGAGFSSQTRGIFTGADSTPGTIGKEHIDYVTISTLGNSADFGDQSEGSTWQRSGASNAVRGFIAGGRKSPTETNSIDYITIATLGNAIDFGDLTYTARYQYGLASPTRGIVAGGHPGPKNEINYIQIMTTGNAIDFGDLSTGRNKGATASNGHGGLG